MSKLAQLRDGLINIVTGLGTTADARTANRYAAREMPQEAIDAAYRGSGLMRKIVEIPAFDSVREWRDWRGDQAKIDAIAAEEKRLNIMAKVYQAEIYRGLGGGALLLGLPGNPEKPAPALSSRKSLAFVNVVSRWQLTITDWNNDPASGEFEMPAMFELRGAEGKAQKIHPSRVVCFRGDPRPAIVTGGDRLERFWGVSRVERTIDAVQNSDLAQEGFAALINKARVTRMGVAELLELTSTEAGVKLLESRLSTMQLMEGIFNATIYDLGDGEGAPAEKIDDVQVNWSGIDKIMAAFDIRVSAVADIPATRLLGRSPEGMNANGDSQQRDWNKHVRARQTIALAPCLDQLDRYLVPSAIGVKAPSGLWYEFAPLDVPTEKERADRFKTEAEAIDKVRGLDAMPEEAFNRGVQSWLVGEGYLPELEDALASIPDAERYGIGAPAYAPGEESDEIDEEGGDVPAALKRAANDATPRPLYVSRKVLNADEILAWAAEQGLPVNMAADDLHVTIAFSRKPVDWIAAGGEDWNNEADGTLSIAPGGARMVDRLGASIALLFNSSRLAYRNEQIRNGGASWDWPDYQPHVSLWYEKGADTSGRLPEIPEGVEPYRGAIELGPEIFEELDK